MNDNLSVGFEKFTGTSIAKEFTGAAHKSNTDFIMKGAVNLFDKGQITGEKLLDIFENCDIIKGGKAAVVGETRHFGPEQKLYIKTINGWRPVPKGQEKQAQQHSKQVHKDIASGAVQHIPPVSQHALQNAAATAEVNDIDINSRFKAYELYTNAVIKGKSKALIAYGSGGTGKTYVVQKQLELAGLEEFDEDHHRPGSEGYDYVKITGKATPLAMYKALYEHNDKIVLFDDCDSVIQHADAINILKGALDTSGDGTITYGSGKKILDEDGEEIPKRFKFKGRIIFISNLPPSQVPQPLKSRALRVDLSMTKQQAMERIRDIAVDKKSGKLTNLKFPGHDKYTHEDMKEVLDYVDKHKEIMSDFNVRTVGSMLAIKQMADEAGEDWKEHAHHMTMSKSFSQFQDRIEAHVELGLISDLSKAKDYQALIQNMYKRKGLDQNGQVLPDTYSEGEWISTDLEKGGEGSKGGKIIGHTKSGKPIYESPTHESHHTFTIDDHKDARALHEKKAMKLYETKDNSGAPLNKRKSAAIKAQKHMVAADHHMERAASKERLSQR